jgi:quercetin dioxygenase-like cupin family protein
MEPELLVAVFYRHIRSPPSNSVSHDARTFLPLPRRGNLCSRKYKRMSAINWDDLPVSQLPATEGTVLRRFVTGDKMTVARIEFSRGAHLPAHRHPNEQFSLVLEGKMEFTIEGTVQVINAGEAVHLKSEEFHGARALEASIILDMFAPPRTDWTAQ